MLISSIPKIRKSLPSTKTAIWASGYDFDALLIDGLDDAARLLTPEQIVERFCYIGNASHIKARYLSGRRI